MDYVTIVLVVGLAGWVEWRFRQMEPKLTAPARIPDLVLQDLEPKFPCYYCGHVYPVSQRERIGRYDYCLEHGSRRKNEMLAELIKEAPKYDRTIRVHPTNSRDELSDNDKLPWVS